MTNQDHVINKLQRELTCLQGRFNALETHLARHLPRLEDAYITSEAKRLFWQKLWQGLDWLLWIAVGSGIGLAMAHALLKS